MHKELLDPLQRPGFNHRPGFDSAARILKGAPTRGSPPAAGILKAP
jgi:hypothetical protein